MGDKLVQVPGYDQPVAFPATMSDDDIGAAIQKNMAAPQESNADKLRRVLTENRINAARQAGAVQNAAAPPTGFMAGMNRASQSMEDFSNAAVPAAGSDIYNLAKGIPDMVMHGADPMAYAGQGAVLGLNYATRRAEGAGVPYAVGAGVNEAIGVNVAGQEQSAREGNPGGVVGHAAAIPIVMAAGEGIARGIGGIKAARAARVAAGSNEAVGAMNLSAVAGLPPEEVAAAVGPIRQTAREMGMQPGELTGEAGRLKSGEVINRTIDKFDSIRESALKSASPAALVDTAPVAAKLRAYAETLPGAPNAAARESVMKMADQWDRPMPLADIDANIKLLNKQLSYDKATGAMIDEAHVAHANRLTAQGLRDVFYDAAESRSGLKGLRNVARHESAVIDLRDGFDKASARASVASARSLTGQPSMGESMLRAGSMKRTASIPVERARNAMFGKRTSLDTLNDRMRGALFGPGEAPKLTRQTVGTAAGAVADTTHFQRARMELGSNASISQIAQRAQQLKQGK